jgi:membrane protein YdbS with pleckstrin-like domain
MSTNDLDFNALWQQQSAPKPDVKSMLEEVKAYQAKNKRKQWLLNTALTTTCLIIVCIWFYYQPQYITTKMGIVCALLAMIILLIVSNKTASDAITNESNSTVITFGRLLLIKPNKIICKQK